MHPETVRRWRLALKIAPCRRHRRGRRLRTSAGRWAAQHDRAFTLAEFGEGAQLSDAAAAHRLADAVREGDVVAVEGSDLWVVA